MLKIHLKFGMNPFFGWRAKSQLCQKVISTNYHTAARCTKARLETSESFKHLRRRDGTFGTTSRKEGR